MIFRGDFVKEFAVAGAQQQAVSAQAAAAWRKLPASTRDYYQSMAEAEKRAHKQTYPDYKYSPRKTAQSPDMRKETANAAQAKLRTQREMEEYVPRFRSSEIQTQRMRVTRASAKALEGVLEESLTLLSENDLAQEETTQDDTSITPMVICEFLASSS
jgi:hypothetical protein